MVARRVRVVREEIYGGNWRALNEGDLYSPILWGFRELRNIPVRWGGNPPPPPFYSDAHLLFFLFFAAALLEL